MAWFALLPEKHRGSHERSIPEEQKDEQLLIVQLEPLDPVRAEKLAREQGADDPAEFLKAIENHHAWEFARRPVDVIDLLSYWSEYHQLGFPPIYWNTIFGASCGKPTLVRSRIPSAMPGHAKVLRLLRQLQYSPAVSTSECLTMWTHRRRTL